MALGSRITYLFLGSEFPRPGPFDPLAAHCCPMERPIERLEVCVREPLAPFRSLLVDAEGERRVLVAELLGDVDRIIPQRCSQARVRPTQRVRAHPLADRLVAGTLGHHVPPPDRRLQAVVDVGHRLAPTGPCDENRILCSHAPAPCLALAEDLYQPAWQVDLTIGASVRLGSPNSKGRGGDADVPPAECDRLPYPQARASEDGKHGPQVRVGSVEQRRELLSLDPGAPNLRLLHAPAQPPGGIRPIGELVLDRQVHDLREELQRLVDPPRSQPTLADLRRLVAIDLGDRDLRQSMFTEERKHVIAERPLVVLDRSQAKLAAPRIEPLGGELVEGRHLSWRLHHLALWRPPDPTLDISEDVPQLSLGARPVPAVFRLTKGDVVAVAVGAEPNRPSPAARRLDHLPGCLARHSQTPVAHRIAGPNPLPALPRGLLPLRG